MADAMVAAWLGRWTVAVGFIGFSAPLQRIGWIRLAGLHSHANDGPIESDHRSQDGVCYPSQFVHGMHKRTRVPQADEVVGAPTRARTFVRRTSAFRFACGYRVATPASFLRGTH